MTDEEKIKTLYIQMYSAMINKDRNTLEKIHADTFYLVHMTGMRQNKQEYISAIMNGTLNYYNAVHEIYEPEIKDGFAKLTGKSRVEAAVFGGGKHTWKLRLDFELEKKDNSWYFTKAAASTY